MLARLLEDNRYIGSGVYPAIIGKETMTAAAALRGEKTTPYLAMVDQDNAARKQRAKL